MLPASKHLNIVMGVDIHLVNIPPAMGVPMPHPFIGNIMDPTDYIPFVGSQVHINKQKRSNADTTATLGTKKHIPMGAGFFAASIPLMGHEGVQFFGSQTVRADGSYFSVATNNLMTCSCVGTSIGAASLYLPTSTSIPIPMGPPVIVGGPQVPNLLGMATQMLMAGGLKFLQKKAGKLFKKGKRRNIKGCNCKS